MFLRLNDNFAVYNLNAKNFYSAVFFFLPFAKNISPFFTKFLSPPACLISHLRSFRLKLDFKLSDFVNIIRCAGNKKKANLQIQKRLVYLSCKINSTVSCMKSWHLNKLIAGKTIVNFPFSQHSVSFYNAESGI